MPEQFAGKDRLEGWKDIATYLRREVRTVQRWEKNESLPVHRQMHERRAVPYAFAHELDAWVASREAPSGAPPWRRGTGRVAAASLIALALGGAFILLNARRTPPLTNRDSILLADFRNSTDDPVFGRALGEALLVGLEQSPFLNVVPRDRVRDTLRLMGRHGDERLDDETARDVCRRLRVKAFVSGSIDALGHHYVIGLNALNCQTGDSLAREQVEAAAREDVLRTLGQAMSRFRVGLGETLPSLRKFDAPLEQVTTSSLEALEAFSAGEDRRARESQAAAVPLFRRAIELDPNFAMAYDRLGSTYRNLHEIDSERQYLQQAYALRDRASERERFDITARYLMYVVGDHERQLETFETWARAYPRDWYAAYQIAEWSWRDGRFEKALDYAQRAHALNPDTQYTYDELNQEYEAFNRFDDARRIIEQAFARGLETMDLHRDLFDIAAAQGDVWVMAREAAWAAGKPDEELMLESRAYAAALVGRMRQSRALMADAVRIIEAHGRQESAAWLRLQIALVEAASGYTENALRETRMALDESRTILIARHASLVAAFAANPNLAATLLDEWTKRSPAEARRETARTIGPVQALIALAHHDAMAARERLDAAGTRNLGGWRGVIGVYVRGLTLLASHDPTGAAAEFKRILDHQGIDLTSIFFPLSHLQQGRAYAAAGDASAARRAYEAFLSAWKDGDPDVPVLVEARREHARLR